MGRPPEVNIGLSEEATYDEGFSRDVPCENPRLETLKTLSKGPNSPSSSNECRRRLSGSYDFMANSCTSPRQVDLNDESQKENVDNSSSIESSRQRSPRAVISDPRNGLKDQISKHRSLWANSPQETFECFNEEACNNDSVVQEFPQVDHRDADRLSLDYIKQCLKSRGESVDTTKCSSPKSDMVSLSQSLKSSPTHPDQREIHIDTSSCPSPSPSCKSPGRARSPIPPISSPLQPSSVYNCSGGGSRNQSQRSFFSPSNSSTTSTSKSADSQYLQVKESRTVTFTERRFCEQMGNESPGIVEGKTFCLV